MIRYLAPWPPPEAGSATDRLYSQIRQDFGILAEPLTLHTPHPGLLAGAWAALRETLVVGEIPRHRKEHVALEVSRLNRCPYCIDAHEIMLRATESSEGGDALAAWARHTATPGAPALSARPFPPSGAPEILGTALCFHYINRMVQVLLDESPIPRPGRWVRGASKRVSAWYFAGPVRRPKEPGASLTFLPASSLPDELEWADGTVVGDALSRWFQVVTEAGSVLDAGTRELAGEVIANWRGAEVGDEEIRAKVDALPPEDQAAGRLVLKTALAPHRVGEAEIDAFREHQGEDRDLVAALAWASLTVARHLARSW